MRHGNRWAMYVGWLALAACSRAGDPRTGTLGSATAVVARPAPEPPSPVSVASPQAEPPAPAASASSSAPGCATPRVVLTRGTRRDEGIAVLAELIRVFPELSASSFEERLQPEPCESTLEARCADAAACTRLATLFEQVDRTQRPRSVCEATLEGGASQLQAPKSRPGAMAACARIRACELLVSGAPLIECDVLPEPGAECARHATCTEVARCAERARAGRPSTPQPRLPRARPLNDPCAGRGLGY